MKGHMEEKINCLQLNFGHTGHVAGVLSFPGSSIKSEDERGNRTSGTKNISQTASPEIVFPGLTSFIDLIIQNYFPKLAQNSPNLEFF